MSKIKGSTPDVLFLPNYFNDVPLQIQQARKLGMTCKVIGSDGWDNQELIKMGGKDMEGTYFTNLGLKKVPVADGTVKKYTLSKRSLMSKAFLDIPKR